MSDGANSCYKGIGLEVVGYFDRRKLCQLKVQEVIMVINMCVGERYRVKKSSRCK